MQIKSTKDLHEQADGLVTISEGLAGELLKYQPFFEGNGKKSLIVLAGVARYLRQEYEALEVDLVKQYERNS